MPHSNIVILTVLKDLENVEEYRLAQNTFECYARFHQYKWKVINFSSNKTLQKICPHSDVSEFLRKFYFFKFFSS